MQIEQIENNDKRKEIFTRILRQRLDLVISFFGMVIVAVLKINYIFRSKTASIPQVARWSNIVPGVEVFSICLRVSPMIWNSVVVTAFVRQLSWLTMRG